jgi:hypothetical protein
MFLFHNLTFALRCLRKGENYKKGICDELLRKELKIKVLDDLSVPT